jgi:uncharacterized protein YifE (UPF0438 family)
LQNKNVKGYALCVLQDPAEPNLIFAGTEQGLWVSMDNAASFQQFKNNYPSVSTYDLAIQEREADLCIATFGRAMYVLDDIRPLRKLAANKGIINKKFIAFTNNDAHQVTYKNAPGYEWSTWGVWDATNKRAGAAINFYANISSKVEKVDTAKIKKEVKLDAKKDTVIAKFYNLQNELVRTLEWAADSGYNKKYWRMDEKGIRYPSSDKPKPNAAEVGGSDVLPGTYKIVFSFNSEKDSSFITIKADPRKPDNTAIVKTQKALTSRLEKSGIKLTEGLDQLADASDIVKKYEATLKDVETPMADSIRKQSKKITEQIKEIKEFITGKKVERQGYGQLPEETVMTAYSEALDYINNKNVAPNFQDEQLVVKSEAKIAEAIKKLNTFFGDKWKAYQALIENNKVNLFKEFKQL